MYILLFYFIFNMRHKMGPVVKEPTELYGIRFNNPNAIRNALCKISCDGNDEKLRQLLKIKAVRHEIDKASSKHPTMLPLGEAVGSSKFESALVLLRHGANPSVDHGWVGMS